MSILHMVRLAAACFCCWISSTPHQVHTGTQAGTHARIRAEEIDQQAWGAHGGLARGSLPASRTNTSALSARAPCTSGAARGCFANCWRAGGSVSGDPHVCFEEKSKHFKKKLLPKSRYRNSVPAAPAAEWEIISMRAHSCVCAYVQERKLVSCPHIVLVRSTGGPLWIDSRAGPHPFRHVCSDICTFMWQRVRALAESTTR